MDAAVAQLLVIQRHLLGALASLLGNSGYRLTLFFAFLYLGKHRFGYQRLLVQEVVELALDEVVDEFIHRRAIFIHHRAAQLNLCLRLEDWLHHLDADCRHHARAYVAILEVLVEKLLDGARHSLAECTLVRAALRGVLTVDK